MDNLLLMSRSYKAWKVLYWVAGLVAGICKTITNSASAEARVEAMLSLAIMARNYFSDLVG